jgi:hypothetical protein
MSRREIAPCLCGAYAHRDGACFDGRVCEAKACEFEAEKGSRFCEEHGFKNERHLMIPNKGRKTGGTKQ